MMGFDEEVELMDFSRDTSPKSMIFYPKFPIPSFFLNSKPENPFPFPKPNKIIPQIGYFQNTGLDGTGSEHGLFPVDIDNGKGIF